MACMAIYHWCSNSLFRTAPDESTRCVFLLVLARNATEKLYFKANADLLPKQFPGADIQRILVLLVVFSLLLEYKAQLQYPRTHQLPERP